MRYLYDDGDAASPHPRPSVESIVARVFHASHASQRVTREEASELAKVAEVRLGVVRLTRASPIRASLAIRGAR